VRQGYAYPTNFHLQHASVKVGPAVSAAHWVQLLATPVLTATAKRPLAALSTHRHPLAAGLLPELAHVAVDDVIRAADGVAAASLRADAGAGCVSGGLNAVTGERSKREQQQGDGARAARASSSSSRSS